jgi:hypothetical protein
MDLVRALDGLTVVRFRGTAYVASPQATRN